MFETITGGAVAGPGGCPVCGSWELWLDGVEQSPQIWMQLAECSRCEYRWTAPGPEPLAAARGLMRAGPPAARGGDARAA